MTEEQFERDYPTEKYDYVLKSNRTKGSMGETEIDVYDIISKETGLLVLTATRTEHTSHRPTRTTTNWNW
ncbi:hypothetical protein ACCP41_004278 [Escherichia coli]|uniref:hypothetical protein n=1 Tax=Escherichia coli TaxID=562 RepID=UPI000BE3DC31|nr:hypothetical protein [Escherichia coli]EFI4641637.1 hypothetical protein [Escherichia coli]EKD2570930.1 hypothetical protein [Escherichia coli]EKG5188012.1 hypothetical protein [Escherichia coli]EKP1647343.1 hypothetical protein [Escherichia coli]MCN3254404.1 hypothetical protein [Escherichia coli]